MATDSPDLERNLVQIRPADYITIPFLDEITSDDFAMDVNGSVTPVRFAAKFAPSTGDVCIVQKITLMMEMVTKAEPDQFGDLVALTNGVTLNIEDVDSNLYNKVFLRPVQNNAQFGLYSGIGFSGIVSGPSAGLKDSETVTIAFDTEGLQLILKRGDKFVLTVNDDLTGLTSFCGMAHGYVKV